MQLSGSTSEETYINANWVSGFAREREYILTQGPMSNTILDFWRMVWESNARNIVMITKLIEGDRVKCEKYFADRGEKYKIGDFLLAWSTTDVHPHFKLTTMTLGRVDVRRARRRREGQAWVRAPLVHLLPLLWHRNRQRLILLEIPDGQIPAPAPALPAARALCERRRNHRERR